MLLRVWVLGALTVAIGLSEFIWGQPAGATMPGRIVAGMEHALTPLIIALAILGLTHVVNSLRGEPAPAVRILLDWWYIVLGLFVLGHVGRFLLSAFEPGWEKLGGLIERTLIL